MFKAKSVDKRVGVFSSRILPTQNDLGALLELAAISHTHFPSQIFAQDSRWKIDISENTGKVIHKQVCKVGSRNANLKTTLAQHLHLEIPRCWGRGQGSNLIYQL